MPKKCCICNVYHMKENQRSFHKFPKNLILRRKWFAKLGIPHSETISAYTYICSDHFGEKDFLYSPSGIRYLRQTAVPFSGETSSSRINVLQDITLNPPDIPNEDNIQEVASGSSTETASEFEDGSFENEGVKPLGSSSTGVAPELENYQPSSSTGVGTKRGGTLQNTEEPLITGIFKKPSSSDTETASETINIDVNEEILKRKLKDHTESSFSTSTTETANEDMNLGQSPPRKRRRLHYYGDIHSSDFENPARSRRSWRIVKSTVLKQKQQIRNLQQSRRRLKWRITSLTSLFKYLRQNNLISENAETAIQASLPGDAANIFKRILKGPSRQKYDAALRSFALTLHFYSPKAYNFVRQKFNKSLPHPSTITKWYQTIDGSPGFTKEAQDALKIKSKLAAEKGQKLFCNLVMDEITIRKRVEWTGKKYTGYVDVGTDLDSDWIPKAKEALVFMLVGINSHWKVPVGYFFLDGLSGSERANLVNQCLVFIHETDVIVTSLTFDGAPANFTMAKCLGAKLMDPCNMTTYFQHPVTQKKIFIFLDACHMLKLIRNCLGSLKTLIIDDKFIDWKYLVELVNLQDIEGLQAATKLKKRHLEWTQEKMRVKIAAQTFSKSVSDALNYLCLDLKLHSFQGAEETAKFVKTMNDFFDILNSRSRFSKYLFQRPLSASTKDTFFKFLEDAEQYFVDLKLPDGSPAYKSARKTGFLGFIICAKSLKQFYLDYVECDTPLLKYILTYKFSQDHLEIFFSAIRSRGGYNNNPTARQFEASYKKLLIHSEIKGSDSANAIAIDSTSILHCSSKNTLTAMRDDDDAIYDRETLPNIEMNLNEHDYAINLNWHLTDYVLDIIGYIAGFIVKSLRKKITCIKCLKIIVCDEATSKLQIRKQYGNLVNASSFVIEVCQIAEKYFRWLNKSINIFNKKRDKLCDELINQTMKNIPSFVFHVFGDHVYDDFLENHSIVLVKLILRNYFNLRIHHECKKEENTIRRVRSILTKTILFRNQ